MRVIGCGNRHRGDDGAGILVAEQLRQMGFDAKTEGGGTAGLIEAWNGADDVVVVDAVATGATPGTVQLWDGKQLAVPDDHFGSTHGLGVAEAIALARVLGLLPKHLSVYGIEGRRFDYGDEISPEVERAVNELVRKLAAQAVS